MDTMKTLAFSTRTTLLPILLAAALGLPGCRHFPPRHRLPFPGVKPAPAPTPTARAALDPAVAKKIEAICRDLIADRHAPGIVVLVGRGGQALFREAYGYRLNDPDREPMTVDTLFDLASLTKPTCTALAILFLVQDGRVEFEAPVGRYVPEFNTPDKADITIRHLLTHTSGLPAYTSAGLVEQMYGPRPNPDGLIRHIAVLPKKYATGTDNIYSCLNYLVLGRVVSNVTGRSLDAFMRRRLWNPLGMDDTTFFPTPKQLARTAPTIHNGALLRRGEVHDPLAFFSVCRDHAPGNAGCFSTVDDMGRLVRMLLDGGKVEGRRILEPAILEKIMTDQTGALHARRTFGWELGTQSAYISPRNTAALPALVHTGYTGTLVWMDRRTKAYVIFFSNSVYPADEKSHKNAIIMARRELVKAVLTSFDTASKKPEEKAAKAKLVAHRKPSPAKAKSKSSAKTNKT
jgi:CubicO group peptidase (beta-lactamase class C family)